MIYKSTGRKNLVKFVIMLFSSIKFNLEMLYTKTD